jgi:hypothetical protein
MTRRIKLTITDTLAFYNPSVKDYTYDAETTQTTTYWFALPDGAIHGNEIRPAYRETLLRAIYGESGRQARDGSKYIVLSVQPTLPTLQEESESPWVHDNSPCVVLAPDGVSREVAPVDF